MHLPYVIKGLGVAFIALITSTHGHSQPVDTRTDLHCGKGLYTGFIHASYTYNAPLHKFTNLTKSFFDNKWYAGAPADSTTGINNVPGATRAGENSGSRYNETLLVYVARPEELIITHRGSPWTYHTAQQPPLYFSGYVQTMRFESICEGKATYIDAIAYMCFKDPTVAYDIWATYHTVVIAEGLAVTAGATVLPGDCPRA
ncbi:hypothetical protein C8R43DRAFT_903529 [Mycena crocata]|nr:hypothetical protein C8R43DRAFT_903529 [Mycena crocata]